MSSFSSKLGDLWARLPPLWLGGITDWPGEYEHEGVSPLRFDRLNERNMPAPS